MSAAKIFEKKSIEKLYMLYLCQKIFMFQIIQDIVHIYC